MLNVFFAEASNQDFHVLYSDSLTRSWALGVLGGTAPLMVGQFLRKQTTQPEHTFHIETNQFRAYTPSFSLTSSRTAGHYPFASLGPGTRQLEAVLMPRCLLKSLEPNLAYPAYCFFVQKL